MAKQTVTLAPGESKVVTFETTPSKAKTYQVSVDGLSASFKAIGVPDIRLSNLIIKATYVGAPASVAVTATNYGTETGSRTVRCQVPLLGYDKSKTVTLAPGQSKRVSWLPFVTEPGTYQVSVNGLTGSFTLIEVIYTVGIGIFDEAVPESVAGTVIVDGVEHFTVYHWIEPLPEGSHSFNLIVPSGYQFIRFEIYNWETGELLRTTSSRPVWVEINTLTYIQAIVHPT